MNIRYRVELNQTERDELKALLSGGRHAARKLKRAQILLAADAGASDEEIARNVGVGGSTIYRIKRRFVLGNLEAALSEEPRPGADRKLSGKEEALLVATACSSPPKGRARWTLEPLADEMVRLTEHDNISRETVRRRLEENELKPWRKDMWCIPQVDGEFVARMEDVLDLYAEEPDRKRPVVCFDESPTQLIGEVRQLIKAKLGQLERYDCEYKRNGTANLFIFLDVHRPWRKVKITDSRTAVDYAACMRELVDVHFPKAERIRVVLDNLSTHTAGALYQAFPPAEARRLRDTGTGRGLYSPTQVTQPVDRQVLLPPVRRGLESLMGRTSKTMLGLGIVAAVGFVPFKDLLQTSSVEAVVNARVITLRAPSDGEVQPGLNPLALGTSVARGDVLFRIVNRRPDRSRVDDLTHQIAQVKDERSGIAARLANARMLLNDLTEQTRLFSGARILQLEARQGELEADVAAARARTEETKTSLDRFMTLAGKGWLPRAQMSQAKRDGLIAEKTEAAAQKRLEAVGIEFAAAQRGVFVGGGNNDRPRYMQRVDELEQQVSNLAEALAERDQPMIRLNDKLTEEKASFHALHAADVIALAKGSVLEILTVPEEQVHRGQDLLRMLDCSEPIVTAVVSDAISSRIQVGSPCVSDPVTVVKSFPER